MIEIEKQDGEQAPGGEDTEERIVLRGLQQIPNAEALAMEILHAAGKHTRSPESLLVVLAAALAGAAGLAKGYLGVDVDPAKIAAAMAARTELYLSTKKREVD